MATNTDFDAGKKGRVRSHLLKRVNEGQTYFKSRYIAREVGLSPKEVGAIINILRETAPDLKIERWGYSRGTTWRIESVS